MRHFPWLIGAVTSLATLPAQAQQNFPGKPVRVSTHPKVLSTQPALSVRAAD